MATEKGLWYTTKKVTGSIWDGAKEVTEDVWEGTKDLAGNIKEKFSEDHENKKVQSAQACTAVNGDNIKKATKKNTRNKNVANKRMN